MKILKYPLIFFGVCLILLSVYESIKISIAQSKTPEVRLQYLSEDAIEVKLNEIPEKWVDDLVKIQDPNFYNHKGFDVSTPGAGLTTITQAMTKYMYFDNFRAGFKKIEQTLIARFVVDANFSKEEQLEIFYNSAYLGHLKGVEVRGFPQASSVYFSKKFSDLSDDEYLSLVAMLVAPKTFSIAKNPEKNSERVDRIKNFLSGKYRPKGVRDIMYDKNA